VRAFWKPRARQNPALEDDFRERRDHYVYGGGLYHFERLLEETAHHFVLVLPKRNL
jgi:hypothetical protein